MSKHKRKVEVFSAGCPLCQTVIAEVKEAACPSCDVEVFDMNASDIQERAAELGISSMPAIVIDGKLAGCCAERGFDLKTLRAAGLGRPIV